MQVTLFHGLVAGLLGIGVMIALRPRSYVHEQSVQLRQVPLWLVPFATAAGGFATALLNRGDPIITGLLVAAWIWGVSLSVIDIEVHRLPNRIVLPAYPVVTAVLAVAAGVEGEWWSFGRAMVCMVGAVVVYLTLAVLVGGSSGLGLGDVKLAGVLAALLGWFSWGHAVVGLVGGFILAALVAAILLVGGFARRTDHLPFGPAMIISAAVVWTLPGL